MPEFERYFLEGSNGLTWYPLPEIEVGIEMELKRIVRELKLKSPTRDKGPQSPRPTHLLNWLMSEFLSASRSARNRRIRQGKRLAEIRQRSADPIFFGKGDAEESPSVVDPAERPGKTYNPRPIRDVDLTGGDDDPGQGSGKRKPARDHKRAKSSR